MVFASKTYMEVAKLSGTACVKRLRELGFNVVRRMAGLSVLKRDGHNVLVPEIESLEREMLRAILRSAGVSEAEFYRAGSGTYAKTLAPDTALATFAAKRRRERNER